MLHHAPRITVTLDLSLKKCRRYYAVYYGSYILKEEGCWILEIKLYPNL